MKQAINVKPCVQPHARTCDGDDRYWALHAPQNVCSGVADHVVPLLQRRLRYKRQRAGRTATLQRKQQVDTCSTSSAIIRQPLTAGTEPLEGSALGPKVERMQAREKNREFLSREKGYVEMHRSGRTRAK